MTQDDFVQFVAYHEQRFPGTFASVTDDTLRVWFSEVFTHLSVATCKAITQSTMRGSIEHPPLAKNNQLHAFFAQHAGIGRVLRRAQEWQVEHEKAMKERIRPSQWTSIQKEFREKLNAKEASHELERSEATRKV